MQKDDLNAFHVRVFGSAVAHAQTMPVGLSSDDEGTQEMTLEEGDDLGFYPDGEKRTLTDDQIAMFRHSEIYSILRGRQVRMENKGADGNDQSDDLVSNAATTPDSLKSNEVQTTGDHERAHEERENGFEELEVIPKSSTANNKRKRSFVDLGGRSGKASTRRLVRELDSVTVENQVLDYGDEPSEKVPSTHAHSGKEDADPVAGHYGKRASVPGKKIWWPVIQAT